MANEMKDYVDNFRANLPAGITYDSDIARYFCNNRRFFNEWEVERYLNYITKFGFSPIPAALFANGEQGAWYDPSDLTTLYQDSAGTTAVTADGDPVGYMADKSGNGNHATQATSASRPVYRTDGTLHWLEVDGVDDNMDTPVGALDHEAFSFVIAATDNNSKGRFLENRGKGIKGSETGWHIKLKNPDADGFFVDDGSGNYREFETSWSGGKRIWSGDYENNTARLWVDRTQETVDGVVGTLGSITRSATGKLFSNLGASDQFFVGKCFGIVVVDRVTTSPERESTEAYLASKSGVTL